MYVNSFSYIEMYCLNYYMFDFLVIINIIEL